MFGDDFVQAVTDRVTFAVQHFDGQVMMIMVILMIILMIMMMMMIIMVTQHIPTMTKSHHGGKMSVMIKVGICQ